MRPASLHRRIDAWLTFSNRAPSDVFRNSWLMAPLPGSQTGHLKGRAPGSTPPEGCRPVEAPGVYSMMSALTVAADGPGAEREVTMHQGMEPAQTVRLTANSLCSRYSATICRFAAMAAGTELDAEDLAQDALLKAVRSLDRFDPSKGSVDGWLWRIVVNAAHDSHRSRARRLALWKRLASRWHEPTETVEDRALQ